MKRLIPAALLAAAVATFAWFPSPETIGRAFNSVSPSPTREVRPPVDRRRIEERWKPAVMPPSTDAGSLRKYLDQRTP